MKDAEGNVLTTELSLLRSWRKNFEELNEENDRVG